MRFLLPFVLLFTVGCHTINSVSLTQIPQQRSKKVEAEVSKFIFLGFNFNNDYVDNLSQKLQDQCEGGQVRGILTKDTVINYFLMLFHTRQITASGYCVSGNGKKVSFLEIQP